MRHVDCNLGHQLIRALGCRVVLGAVRQPTVKELCDVLGKLWGGTGELHVMGAGTGIVRWVWGTILYRMAWSAVIVKQNHWTCNNSSRLTRSPTPQLEARVTAHSSPGLSNSFPGHPTFPQHYRSIHSYPAPSHSYPVEARLYLQLPTTILHHHAQSHLVALQYHHSRPQLPSPSYSSTVQFHSSQYHHI